MRLNKTVILTIGITLVVGVAIGAIFFGGTNELSQAEGGHQHEVNAQGLWTCSMHPQVRQAEAGSCPFCGMDLIPVSTDDTGDPTVLKMSSAALQLANIQTTVVGNSSTAGVLRLNGKIKVDQRQVNLQTTHFGGRVEKLYKGFVGDVVRKGDKVASIYSPELVSAQEELIEAKKLEKSNPILLDAARRKLHHWKLSMKQIESIETSKEPLRNFDLLSDYEGVVSKKVVNTGNHLHEGGGLIEVTDLSTVWAVFEVYERDLDKVALGDEILFETSGGQAYNGKVSFISPEVNPRTRVVEVRADVENKGMSLKPEMFIEASIARSGTSGLTVPKSAVLWTGKRSVVYVKLPNEQSFQLREVELGESMGDAYMIDSGLAFGDEVVTNGAFTLDAEAQLKGKISMMNQSSTSVSNPESIFDEVDLPVAKNYKDEVEPEFREQLTTLSLEYVKLKDLMVEGNGADIRKAGINVKLAFEKVNMPSENGGSYEHWVAMSKPIAGSLEIITQTGDRDKQRLQFINLSKALINAVQSFGTSYENTLYIQFCPMANDNQGATWISKEEEIINPYFGDVMLNCGNVEDVITK